jgi:hypothetical protein
LSDTPTRTGFPSSGVGEYLGSSRLRRAAVPTIPAHPRESGDPGVLILPRSRGGGPHPPLRSGGGGPRSGGGTSERALARGAWPPPGRSLSSGRPPAGPGGDGPLPLPVGEVSRVGRGQIAASITHA